MDSNAAALKASAAARVDADAEDWGEDTSKEAQAQRRAEEMREVAETVRGTGLAPLMATATAERQQWMADLGAKEAVRAANGGKSSEDGELLVRVIRDCMTQSATVVE
jgi:hypothetical protein